MRSRLCLDGQCGRELSASLTGAGCARRVCFPNACTAFEEWQRCGLTFCFIQKALGKVCYLLREQAYDIMLGLSSNSHNSIPTPTADVLPALYHKACHTLHSASSPNIAAIDFVNLPSQIVANLHLESASMPDSSERAYQTPRTGVTAWMIILYHLPFAPFSSCI